MDTNFKILILILFIMSIKIISANNYILGGHEVDISEAPYQVQVELIGVNGSITHHCGGAIIGEEWIITSAHCVSNGLIPLNPSSLMIHAGTSIFSDNTIGQRINVEEVILHPYYAPFVYGEVVPTHDIALLRLSEPLEFNDNVKAITYATPQNTSLNEINPGNEVFITGWGETGNGSYSTTLQGAEMEIISNEEAQDIGGWPTGYIIDDSMISFFRPGRGASLGDGGGPAILISEDNLPILVGVASWGNNGISGQVYPSIYANIYQLSGFIDQNIYCDDLVVGITTETVNGEAKSQFCLGEDIILNGSMSTSVDSYIVTVQFLNSNGIDEQYAYQVTSPYVNLNDYFNNDFEFIDGINYKVSLSFNHPICGTVSKSLNFSYKDCCDQVIDASFNTEIRPIDGSSPLQYELSANSFEIYDFANPIHEWKLYISDNSNGGPYTLVDSYEGTMYNYQPVLNDKYYFLIHRVISECGEICYAISTCLDCPISQPIGCEILECEVSPPYNLSFNEFDNRILRWENNSPTGLYNLVIVWDDIKNCCPYSQAKPFKMEFQNLVETWFRLPDPPGDSYCFSWAVSSICANNIESWSGTKCDQLSNTQFSLKQVDENVEITVNPNPSIGRFANTDIKFNQTQTYSLKIYNLEGELIEQYSDILLKNGCCKLKIDKDRLKLRQSNIYIFKFITENLTITRKIIIN